MTILEVLQSAQYNLNENGPIGVTVAKQQLNNALEQIEEGKDLYDKFTNKED